MSGAHAARSGGESAWGLSAHTLATVRAVLARHPEIDRAVLYGSRALGTFREGSDIDLVLTGSAVTEATRGAVWSELDDSEIPYMVDVAVLAAIGNPALRDHIQRVGVVLYQRDGAP